MPPSRSNDRLARAIAIHHQFLAAGGRDATELLAAHPDLRDVLEPLLHGEDEPLADDGPEDGRLGDFRLHREIGRGAMGVVYEAEQVSLGRTVALKVLPAGAELDARAVARFQREAQLAGALDHPSIPKVHGSGSHNGQHWFAMELVRGAPLSAVLQTLRQAPDDGSAAAFLRALGGDAGGVGAAAPVQATARTRVQLAVDIVLQIADALAVAHAAGVVHRDVKPGNILVRPDGTAALTDFGIARSDAAIALTLTGDFAGTPSYASPEQLRAKPDGIDHRTDIFSLGATLYEALTLHKAFDGTSISDVRLQIERHDPRSPSRWCPGVPRDLDAIVLRALEKDAAARYQSAAAFADDLRRFREGRPVAARAVGRTTRALRWCKRNPVAAALLGTAAGGLLIVTLLSVELRAEGTRAADRLVQFRAMKVGHDVQLLRAALATAPGPSPATAAQLRQVSDSADRLLAQLPMLRETLAMLRRSGIRGGAVAAERLLTEHPAKAHLDQLRLDRDAIAGRLCELQEEGSATPEWAATVGARLQALDREIEQLAPRVGARPRAQDQQEEQLDARAGERRLYGFSDAELEYLHDAVEDQLLGLEWLAERRIPEIRRRAARAAEQVLRPEGDHADAWRAARSAVAANPAYGGLQLPTVPGLAPLGVDPGSGLLEFAHEASGQVPRRNADGQLDLGPESALVLVLVPGGETWIGCQRADPQGVCFDPWAADMEGPPQQVRLEPFLLGKHELTHVQCDRLAHGLDVRHQAARYLGREGWETKPITGITWADADVLCRAHGFCLPTEAQWEHAARARTSTPWWTGGSIESVEAAENVGREDGSVAGRVDAIAGQPNPFGFLHMHGNVSEWCVDPFVDERWSLRAGDGLRAGVVRGKYRAMRGGNYVIGAAAARSAKRNTNFWQDQMEVLGLRPAMALPPR